ncbi:MAG: FkbM family methyltransferase [Rhizobiaceae bacterium]|nr:FkbM family methyltransferase [Rhizobiaceae bacterium]
MTVLSTNVLVSRLYRGVYDPRATIAKAAVYCYPDETDAAAAWFEDVAGRPPEHLIIEGAPRGAAPANAVDIRHVRVRADFDVVVYGAHPRRKAVALALGGIRDVWFATDPAFKHLRDDRNYYKRYRRDLEALAGLLADKESVVTLASVIRHRVTGNHGYLRIATYPEYRHPKVKTEPGDWVIDGGAANGATSFQFAREAGRAGKVIAVEPDPFNFATITAKGLLTTSSMARVRAVHTALSDAPGTTRFRGGQGGSSRIAEDGGMSVKLTTIDQLAADHELNGRGLISLDVEGFEMAALQGGLETIRRLRPKLQVSIYHRKTDLFKIPLWLKEQLPDYRFFLGHHDAYHSETDLYACPA